MNGSDESILSGEDAALSNLRGPLLHAADRDHDCNRNDTTLDTAIQQRMDATADERLLLAAVPVVSTLTCTADDATTANNDNSNDSNDNNDSDTPQQIAGVCMVTSEQVWFVANDVHDAAHDLAVAAAAIDLHAVQAEPAVAVYIQLRAGATASHDGGGALLEWTLQLAANNGEAAAQTLFEALAELVELHPITDDTDDYNMMAGNNNAGGAASGMMMMMMGAGGVGGAGTGGAGGGGEWMGADGVLGTDAVMQMAATNGVAVGAGAQDENDHDLNEEQQRQAMLERFDEMLVVPDDLVVAQEQGDNQEQKDNGQFDDAEDDDIL